MKLELDSNEQEVRIELIPLIDVIFCILTFFILAAMTITRQTAINIDLPPASTGTPQMRDILVVSVDPVGQIFIDKQPVTRDQLYQSLLNYQQSKPQGLMVLYASRLASYNDVVQVLDLLRSVGGNRVALATLPDAGTQAQPQEPQLQLPGTTPNLGNPNPGNPNLGNPNNPFEPFSAPNLTDPFNPNQPVSPTEPGTGSSSGLNNSGSANPGFTNQPGLSSPPSGAKP